MKYVFAIPSFAVICLLSQSSIAADDSIKKFAFDSVSPKTSALNPSPPTAALAAIDLTWFVLKGAPSHDSPPSNGSAKKKPSPRDPIKRPSAIKVIHVPLTKAERVLGKEPDPE